MTDPRLVLQLLSSSFDVANKCCLHEVERNPRSARKSHREPVRRAWADLLLHDDKTQRPARPGTLYGPICPFLVLGLDDDGTSSHWLAQLREIQAMTSWTQMLPVRQPWDSTGSELRRACHDVNLHLSKLKDNESTGLSSQVEPASMTNAFSGRMHEFHFSSSSCRTTTTTLLQILPATILRFLGLDLFLFHMEAITR